MRAPRVVVVALDHIADREALERAVMRAVGARAVPPGRGLAGVLAALARNDVVTLSLLDSAAFRRDHGVEWEWLLDEVAAANHLRIVGGRRPVVALAYR